MSHSSVPDNTYERLMRLNRGEVGEQQELKIGKYVKFFHWCHEKAVAEQIYCMYELHIGSQSKMHKHTGLPTHYIY